MRVIYKPKQGGGLSPILVFCGTEKKRCLRLWDGQ